MDKAAPVSNTHRSLLVVCVVSCSIGYLFQFHHFSSRSFSQFYFEWGYSETFAMTLVHIHVISLILATVSAPFWKLRWLVIPGFLGLALETLCHALNRGEFLPWLAIPNHMLRLAPFLLLLGNFQTALFILKLTTAMTFLGHGIQAIASYSTFLDYILVFLQTTGLHPSEEQGRTLLIMIGTIDIFLAHHLLFFKTPRIRWVLIYMMAWGCITAFARVVHAGAGGWSDVAIRSAHFLIPLLIYRMVFSSRDS
jgi:hypothetical protein